MRLLFVIFALIVATQSQTTGGIFKQLFSASRNIVKDTIKVGSQAVNTGLNLGNDALQKATTLVKTGAEKGATVGKIAVGAGVAVSGHALAIGSNAAVNASGRLDVILQEIPLVGNVAKFGNSRMRQAISSVNKVGQTVLNGVDAISDASISLYDNAARIGTGVISKTAKLGTAVGQTGVAIGTSLVQTGVDNAFSLGENFANQVATGQFNTSALVANITTGAQWIINDNTKQAITNLLPSLNWTLTG